jgi:hypothetical protein
MSTAQNEPPSHANIRYGEPLTLTPESVLLIVRRLLSTLENCPNFAGPWRATRWTTKVRGCVAEADSSGRLPPAPDWI